MIPDLDLLGLLPGATVGDLKARFRDLALIHHPDRGGNAENFVALRDAYNRLLAKLGQPPELQICAECSGAGVVVVHQGFAAIRMRCGACDGTGEKRS